MRDGAASPLTLRPIHAISNGRGGLDDRVTRSHLRGCEESPDSMRRRCRVTPGGGNPRESATENRPPCIRRVRVKRWGKSPPGGRQRNPHGKPHREQCRIGIARGETRRAALPQQIRVGSLIRPVTAGPEEWSSIRGRLRGTESGLQALRADFRFDHGKADPFPAIVSDHTEKNSPQPCFAPREMDREEKYLRLFPSAPIPL